MFGNGGLVGENGVCTVGAWMKDEPAQCGLSSDYDERLRGCWNTELCVISSTELTLRTWETRGGLPQLQTSKLAQA